MLQLLDTTVLIDHLRGRPAAQRVLDMQARGDTPATTAINVEEVVRGLRPAEEEAAQTLVEGLVILPVTGEAAWLAGRWRRDNAARGRTLAQADCLIAAIASLAGTPLVTGNPKDFPMADVSVVHWPVGT
ncbi:hypothetical protein SGUI_1985 [Serinicoccus hydrothermalis]|uniref:Ribonuclease VapC n=1 Tax=Serinicoccus hydrothermalis TaxID=1758689 RepID=A0A1B1NDB6_9MICO|nr:type II toxin-antitoxin system VapC family toxin [Serinicoccus hydrothermalis]ANS79381.1 hypothetical protein SGUI_1985 [Serinicoccus hydrothermalis]